MVSGVIVSVASGTPSRADIRDQVGDSMTDSAEQSGLKRRGFLRGLVATLAGLLALGGSGFILRKKLQPQRKPNIILILADDLGYGDLGSYGQEAIQTPHLDALAAEGMRFTQFYAGSSMCAPSRCCLMTGLHTGHGRIRNNKSRSGQYVALLPEDFTVAELLQDAGYATVLFGKWGMGQDGTVNGPTRHGFAQFLGRMEESRNQYYPEYLWRNEEKEVLEENLYGGRGTYSQDLLTQEALNYIEANQDDPFFLFLSYSYPHADRNLSENGIDENLPVPSDAPYSSEPWPQVERNFAAMITRMDRDIGKILTRLRELGMDQNTCVLFTSDNGPHQEGGHNPSFFKSGGRLRGIKRELHEGGIRVPMIAWWPGTIEPGVVSDQAWASWDLLPTAAHLAGATLPASRQFDGISMLPTLLGEPQRDHAFLYWESPAPKRFFQAVRMGDWKGIRKGYRADIELYDLAQDVREKNDLAERHPQIVAQIARIMETEHTESEDFPIIDDGKIVVLEADGSVSD
jgi:arylsulfatase A-like enzyme